MSSPAPFNKDVLINLDDYKNENNIFFDSSLTSTKTSVSVPLDMIIGINQGMRGITWNGLLDNSHPSYFGQITSRMNKYLNELICDPKSANYYLSYEDKDGISLVQVDDRYFIDTGKHRITIAKYLANLNPDIFGPRPMIHGVEVNKLEPDVKYMDAISSIRWLNKYYPHLSIAHTQPYSPDERCIHISNNNHSYRSGSYSLDEFKHVMDELKKPILRRLVFHKDYSIYYSIHSTLKVTLDKMI